MTCLAGFYANDKKPRYNSFVQFQIDHAGSYLIYFKISIGLDNPGAIYTLFLRHTGGTSHSHMTMLKVVLS